MTKVLGRIVTPNRPSAPSSPDLGEMYYDTSTNVLYWWNGTAWVSTVGGPGPPGPAGPAGTVYDSDQIGTIKTWTGKTVPTNWVLADGARLTAAAYPDGFTFAKQEADAGNPLWTYRTSDNSFTVPDLIDRFILAPGANALGARGGEVLHLLLSGEAAQKAVTSGTESANHQHGSGNAQSFMTSTLSVGLNGDGGATATWLPNGWTGATASQNVAHTHSIAGSDAVTAHNNMPPYVVMAQIVKVKGAQIDSAGALVGPAGAPGTPGTNGVDGTIGGQTQSFPIGDGTARVFTLSHGYATKGVTVSVYQTAAPYSEVTAEVERPDTNRIIVRTRSSDPPPTLNQYTVVVGAPGSALTQQTIVDTWHVIGSAGEPVLTAPWVNYGATWSTPAFRKMPDGKVQLRGAIKSGTVGTIPFTLPVGYRPPASVAFAVACGASISLIGSVYVRSDGAVIFQAGDPAFVPLDVIEFDTESVTSYPYVVPGTAAVVAATMEGWHTVGAAGEPAFQNAWTSFGGIYGPVGFRKDPMGKVQMRGAIQAGATGTVAFTLPVGFRPPSFTYLPVMGDGAAAGNYVGIDPTGTVTAGRAGGTLQLSAVEFDTDTVTSLNVMVGSPPRVTALPAYPIDAQECYYVADATNGVIWHLKYNAGSASAFKWELVGGSRLRHAPFIGPVAFSSPGAFAWNTLPSGPAVTAPLAGEYEVDWNGVLTTTSAATLDFRLKPNLQTSYNIPSGGSTQGGGGVINPKGSGVFSATAGQSVFLQYATPSLSLAVTLYETALWLRPVRVG